MKGGSQYKRGLWTVEEDKILMDYISLHGKGRWNRVAKMTGLKRCGKSCRLRWVNYLSPNVKKGDFTEEEDDLIVRLHKLLGNRWSLIAGRVPGRTDNQVKNHWNTHLSKKLGIKKGKRKLGVNMPKPSRDETRQGERQETSADLDPKLQSSDENSGAMASSGSEISKDDFETSNSLEVVPNEFLVDSFWFSDDNLRLDHSSLMEVPDVYSLDTLWHDL